jgi:hypothetical protein
MKADKQSFKTGSAVNLSTSALNITGLLGDTYDYTIIANFTNASADSILDITLNSDTTANYRNYEMKGLSSTASAAVGDSDTAIELQNIIGTANPGLLIMSITGSSGDERYIDCFYSGDGAILKQSSYWKNTADEVDEITFTAASSVTCDYEITIYRTPKEASQEKWELVDTKSYTSQDLLNNPIDFTVDGNADLQYRLDWRTETSARDLSIRLNSDTGSNYTNQRLNNSSGTIQAGNATTTSTYPNSNSTQLSYIINAESGVKRLITGGHAYIATGYQQTEIATWWNNTVDNVTTISAISASATVQTGEIKLYRRKNPNTIGDTLPFEMVEEVAVSGDFSAGHTFSNLSGDDVLLYKLEFVGDGNSSSDTFLRIQYNGDTGSNYSRQILRSYGSSADANSTTDTYVEIYDSFIGALEDEGNFTHYLYPKSGENRPQLWEGNVQYGASNYLICKGAGWWNNSADEITSIKVFGSNTNSITGTLKLSRITRSHWLPSTIPELEFWWDAETGLTTDNSPNGFTGTNNSVTTNSGSLNSLDTGEFVPTAYIDFGNQSEVNFNRFDAFSVGGVFNTDLLSGRDYFIIAKELNSGNFTGWYILLDDTSNVIRCILQQQGSPSTKSVDVKGNTTLSTGTWYTFLMTYSGSGTAAGVELYIDNVQQSKTTNNDNLDGDITSTASLTVGSRDSGGVSFDGEIAATYIWSKELSEDDRNNFFRYTQNRWLI